MLQDYGDPDKDPGEEVVLGVDPNTGEEHTFFVRVPPEWWVQRLRLEVGIQGKRTYNDLPPEKKIEFSRKLATMQFADAGEKLSIRVGDAGAAELWAKLLDDPSIEPGSEVKLRGRLTDAIKHRIFDLNPRILARVVEAGAELSKRDVALEGDQEKNS